MVGIAGGVAGWLGGFTVHETTHFLDGYMRYCLVFS